jgi:hypothetical protein
MSKPRVGREYQHLEDLAFIEGSAGAMSAVDFLEKLAQDSSHVSLKWDGSIVVYWGRDSAGDFVMTGKNGWGKCKSKSAEELSNFILLTGQGEPWREQFAADMSRIFAILEQSTPHWFRGYVKGDVLWHPGKAYYIEDNEVVFTPNQVTYCADINSNIGKQIANSKLGIAVHSCYLAFGSTQAEPPGLLHYLENDQVVVFSQTYVTSKISVDQHNLNMLKEKIADCAEHIDTVLESRPGLADIKNIIYTYVNFLVKNDLYHCIEDYFVKWLEDAKISANKKEKIRNIHLENKGFDYLFSIVKEISTIKENIINCFDQDINTQREMIRFRTVNEGYVSTEDKIKLVPRTQWKPR